jgi:hypothetical protein
VIPKDGKNEQKSFRNSLNEQIEPKMLESIKNNQLTAKNKNP